MSSGFMGRAESFTELKLTLYTTTRHVCLIKNLSINAFSKRFWKIKIKEMSDGVDWRIRENRKHHRTSCYAQNDLILRRGQDFRKLKIKMTLTYSKNFCIRFKDALAIIFHYMILKCNSDFLGFFFSSI